MAFLPRDLHTRDDTRAFVADALLANETVFVAERHGRVIGFASLDEGLLTQLYVAPSYFGQGSGTALLKEAMSRSPAGLRLWVFEPNLGAIRLYRRHGFVTVAQGNGSGNEEGVPDRLMAWTPDPSNRSADSEA